MYGQGDSATGICSNRDYDFYYQGLAEQKLLIQRCRSCETFRNPPSPMCGECGSLEWDGVPVEGRGTVYSYTVHHYPPLPGFETPHPVGVIELDTQGLRVVAALDGVPLDQLRIGLAVEAEFTSRAGVASLRFRPAR